MFSTTKKAAFWKVWAADNGIAEEIGRGKKTECMKIAKKYMETHTPKGDERMGSVQISPYNKNGGRFWGIYSVRWNAGRKKWVKGEGIR